MKSKFYGKPVTNIWNGVVRYGVVRESKESNGWMYVSCSWVNDEAYKQDISRVCRLRGIEKREKEWIRVDKINFLDIDKEIKKLVKLSHSARQIDGSVDFNYYLNEDTNSFRYSEWT